ncbi:hypothetical protein A2U01_0083769, partial [Trifolium medium]|nr:hypothetical protein [Trifolium medium]
FRELIVLVTGFYICGPYGSISIAFWHCCESSLGGFKDIFTSSLH